MYTQNIIANNIQILNRIDLSKNFFSNFIILEFEKKHLITCLFLLKILFSISVYIKLYCVCLIENLITYWLGKINPNNNTA